MATRGDIRDAVYSEMVSVAGTYDVTDADGNVVDTVTLDAANVGLRNYEGEETQPAIVYHENYRGEGFNGVGTAPDEVRYNDDGTVDAAVYKEYVTAQYLIDVRASNEAAKEPIYEALRTTFGKYTQGAWNESDLHADAIQIEVGDSTSADDPDSEDVIRGDQLEVRITFHRNYEFQTDNISSVSLSTDDNYTIT